MAEQTKIIDSTSHKKLDTESTITIKQLMDVIENIKNRVEENTDRINNLESIIAGGSSVIDQLYTPITDKRNFVKMLDDLKNGISYFVSQNNMPNTKCIVSRNTREFISDLDGMILSVMGKIDGWFDTKSRCDNYTVLLRHEIVDIDFYVIGFQMSTMYNMGVDRHHKSLREIISNIDILYNNRNTKSSNLCSFCSIRSLCYLTYEYLPIDHFFLDFTTYNKFGEINLGQNMSIDIIRTLQELYCTTKDISLLEVLNLYLRRQSGNFTRLLQRLNERYITQYGFVPDSRIKDIYNKCTRPVKVGYTSHKDVSKTYKIYVSGSHITNPLSSDIKVEQAYYAIAEESNSGGSIYMRILNEYNKDVESKEIDISKLHHSIINTWLGELSEQEIHLSYIIHIANMKLLTRWYAIETYNTRQQCSKQWTDMWGDAIN